MKSPIRVRRAPAGLKALGHTSSQVQYYATGLAFMWVQMPKEHQEAIMGFFGFTSQQMLLAGAATWALATLLAKNTSLEFGRKPEPEMNQEGPDHEG
jgi:hypothetical protein